MTTDIHVQAFIEEAFELLSRLEDALLELEEDPENSELIGQVFRSLHTIKGSGSMFGFDTMAGFTHTIETTFDDVREGKLPVSRELISVTLQAKDLIRTMIESPDDTSLSSGAQVILDSIEMIARGAHGGGNSEAGPPSGPTAPAESSVTDTECTYRIRFRPSRGIFLTGTNPILLLNELRSLGQCSVFAQLDEIPGLDALEPESCYVSWDIVLTTDRGIDPIKDVFIFVDDESTVDISVVDDPDAALDGGAYKRLGEILIERKDIEDSALAGILAEKKKIGEILIDRGLVSREKIESALIEQEQVVKARKTSKHEQEAASNIRVPAEKLDTLVNLVGELVTVQARLTQLASLLDIPDLVSIAEEVESLTGDLRDNTLNIRMLPIGTTFGRFKRLVRDLSGELGRQVEMTTEGAETELDKTVIERLNDPLVHLIRNSIDHGIEPPDVRKELGKPATGMLHISARHSGAYVLIEITDDGAGIDRDVVRAKAVEKGIISPDADLTDKEIFSLIFAPGFSTSATVTSVSGRGVGMDVVKRTIDNLRGSVEVSSAKGEGTTVTLRLPLTLAIIEGLLVEIDSQYFILPLPVVHECVELTRLDVERSNGKDIANIRGEIVPYIRLRETFGMHSSRPDIEQIVITEVGRERIGFVVDHVIGEHQTVIKSLGKVYRNVHGISGATILGDGTVALIMDVTRLVEVSYAKAS